MIESYKKVFSSGIVQSKCIFGSNYPDIELCLKAHGDSTIIYLLLLPQPAWPNFMNVNSQTDVNNAALQAENSPQKNIVVDSRHHGLSVQTTQGKSTQI